MCKRISIFILSIMIFVMSLFAPAAQYKADAFSMTAETVLGTAAANPELLAPLAPFAGPALIIGGALCLGYAAYTNREQIAVEGQRFIDWAHTTNQDISSWWNTNGTINVNDAFKTQMQNFVNGEKGITNIPGVTLNGSTNLLSLPLNTPIPAAQSISFRCGGAWQGTIAAGTAFTVVSVGSGTSSWGLPYIRVSAPYAGTFNVDTIYTGDNAHVLAGGNVTDNPSGLGVGYSGTMARAPSAIFGGETTFDGVSTGSVYNPFAPGYNVDSLVGSGTSSVAVPADAISTPATPPDPTTGSPDLLSNFTGLFGWLASILLAIQAIPLAVQAVATSVSAIPGTIGNFFDNVTQSISALPTAFTALFNNVVQSISAIPGSFTGLFNGVTQSISAIPNTFTGLFDCVTQSISAIPNAFTGLFDGVLQSISAIPGTFTALFDDVVSSVSAIPGAFTALFDSVIQTILSIPGAIVGFFDTLGADVLSIPSAILDVLKTLFIPVSISEIFSDVIAQCRDEILNKYDGLYPDFSVLQSGQEPFQDIYMDYSFNFFGYHIDTGEQVIVSAKFINDNISTIRLMTSITMTFFFSVYIYSEIYFMIRGVRPFETSSSVTVNGKKVE